jgi:3-dehydroquinate synthase
VAMRVVGAAEMARAQKLFENVGPLALVVTRAVPVLAEAGTLAAGATRMPFWAFMAATSVSNVGVALAYAGVGAFAASSGSFLIAFLGLTAVPALAWAAWRFYAARRRPS